MIGIQADPPLKASLSQKSELEMLAHLKNITYLCAPISAVLVQVQVQVHFVHFKCMFCEIFVAEF